jgi:hypothetical protein
MGGIGAAEQDGEISGRSGYPVNPLGRLRILLTFEQDFRYPVNGESRMFACSRPKPQSEWPSKAGRLEKL